MSDNKRVFKVKLTERGTGLITYTSISVDAPAGLYMAQKLAESMYGKTHNVTMLA
jgi:hypothetical protein